MLIEIDFSSDEAIYQQLCNQIILGIATSRLSDGEVLPSVRQMADEIGIKRGTVANYEVGRNEPTESVKRVVCETFGVNREWLDTGEGEIFVKKGRDAIVRKMAYKLIVDEEDSFRLKLISVISELSKEQLQVLAYIAEKIIEQ